MGHVYRAICLGLLALLVVRGSPSSVQVITPAVSVVDVARADLPAAWLPLEGLARAVGLMPRETVAQVDGRTVVPFAGWYVTRDCPPGLRHYCPPVMVDSAPDRYVDLDVTGPFGRRRVVVALH